MGVGIQGNLSELRGVFQVLSKNVGNVGNVGNVVKNVGNVGNVGKNVGNVGKILLGGQHSLTNDHNDHNNGRR